MMPRWERYIATGIFGYQIIAVWSETTDRIPTIPTISQLSKPRPWLTGIVVGGLTAHFHPKSRW